MAKPSRDQDQLRHLGRQTGEIPQDYDPELLEALEYPASQGNSWVSLICPEFTSLCPKTGQPDFARISINYIADKKIVESKSLKLYLFSFRNHGGLHEDCIQMICDDLVGLLRPRFIEVMGEYTPRGGIAIYPYVSWALEEKKYQELQEYRERNYSPGKFSLKNCN